MFTIVSRQRAIETADIVAENHPSAERIVIEELAEINWGEWEGIVVSRLANP